MVLFGRKTHDKLYSENGHLSCWSVYIQKYDFNSSEIKSSKSFNIVKSCED